MARYLFCAFLTLFVILVGAAFWWYPHISMTLLAVMIAALGSMKFASKVMESH